MGFPGVGQQPPVGSLFCGEDTVPVGTRRIILQALNSFPVRLEQACNTKSLTINSRSAKHLQSTSPVLLAIAEKE
jgi:hypothetical protein